MYVTVYDFGNNVTKSMNLHITCLKPGIAPPTQQTPQNSIQCDPPVAPLRAEIDASFETAQQRRQKQQNKSTIVLKVLSQWHWH